MTNQIDSWPAGATAEMSVTYTQANAAGGAVVCEISPGSGNEFIVIAARCQNSGTNGARIELATGPGAAAVGLIVRYVDVPSAAGTIGAMPQMAALQVTSGSLAASPWPVIVSGTQELRVYQLAAGAQNDTFTVVCDIRCKGALPSVIHSNSTNAANVSVTAGAESFVTV